MLSSPRSFAVVGMIVLIAPVMAQAAITLTAKDLYGGFDARKVLLDEKAGTLTLDARALKSKSPGIIVTDPIDLGPSDGIVGLLGTVKSVKVLVAADAPDGTTITVEVRSGPYHLDRVEPQEQPKAPEDPDVKSKLLNCQPVLWSGWSKFASLGGNVDNLAGRYAQVRITLLGKNEKNLPSVKSLTITPTVEAGNAWSGRLAVSQDKIQKISRSPIEFVYERPDTPKLAKFRKDAKLDEAIAGTKDDFEKLVKLMDHVGGFHNTRGTGREEKGGAYQWDIDAVFEVKDGKPTVYGHCMTFSEVLVTAASAMGYVGSRHMAMAGYHDKSHEVCDIWVPSLGRWVYFDPSLTQYYFDLKTKTPMNLIELHNLVADKFVPEGKDMLWWKQRPSQETTDVLNQVGGKAHVGCRMGPWHYGDPQDPNYDWGALHGYLCTGIVQMTPRNDFNSNPKAMTKRFSSEPGYDNYPVWVDAKTPPRNGNWYTRLRDFYWTLDQASIRLVQGEEGMLAVELGQTMPFFNHYQVKVDGRDVYGWVLKDYPFSPFRWRLNAGDNKLEVAPVDEFGKVGLASSVVVKYTK